MRSADHERFGVQRCGRLPVDCDRLSADKDRPTVFNGVVATPIPIPPPPPATLETIAGSATLDEVLEFLRARRPVFHSEADLQHSFALAVGEVAPKVRCRLEVPVRGSNASEYLDLLCLGPAGRTAIEFKYVTRQWSSTAGTPPEEYALRGHNAPDVARRDFLRDVARLERFCDREDQNGLALLITNEAALWRPRQRGMPTRDEEFRTACGERCGREPGRLARRPGRQPITAQRPHRHRSRCRSRRPLRPLTAARER